MRVNTLDLIPLSMNGSCVRASGEPGGWMTVKDEGGEKGQSEEQASTEGLNCCRRKEGGVDVLKSLMR